MTDLTKYFPDGLEINPKQFEAEDLFRKGYKIKAVSIEIGLSEFEVAGYRKGYLETRTREKALDYYAMGCSIKVVANLAKISLDEAQKYAELFLHEMRKHESQRE